jgi:DNA-binding transcriptional MerR regulator
VLIIVGRIIMEVLKDRYTITELSQRLGITDHALRYYEKEFNLSIPKDGRGRRYYEPEQANIMYQIKSMRDEGLEIKAIRKILQSENIIPEPPPVSTDENSLSLTGRVQPNQTFLQANELKEFFNELRDQITCSVSLEVASAQEEITREINNTKLELGACVENSARKIEYKMDKHFSEIDRMIGLWREKNKPKKIKNILKSFLNSQ